VLLPYVPLIGKSQIIHVDRMRKRNPQILGGETEQPSDSVEENSGESVKSEDREQFSSFQENCNASQLSKLDT
jgi:hypothetical protein